MFPRAPELTIMQTGLVCREVASSIASATSLVAWVQISMSS